MPLLIVQFTKCSGISLLIEARKCIINMKRMLGEVQSTVGIASHGDIFHLTFLNTGSMSIWCWMFQDPSIGNHISRPKNCLTFNRAVWESWVYQRLPQLWFTRHKLFSVEHEWVWTPKKAIFARRWQRQYPDIRDSRNEGRGQATLVTQVNKSRFCFTSRHLWTSMPRVFGMWIPQLYPVAHQVQLYLFSYWSNSAKRVWSRRRFRKWGRADCRSRCVGIIRLIFNSVFDVNSYARKLPLLSVLLVWLLYVRLLIWM